VLVSRGAIAPYVQGLIGLFRRDMHESTSHQLNTNLFVGSADHDSLMAVIASTMPASRMNFFIIDFIDIGPHLNMGQDLDGRRR
jgi:hypothetical protein